MPQLEQAEVERLLSKEARIAVNYGPTFGKGGKGWLRFVIRSGPGGAGAVEWIRSMRKARNR